MHYEINVSLNGSHLFATHERSLDYNNVAQVYALFKRKFPVSEGYLLTVTRRENVIYPLTESDILDMKGTK